MFARVLLSLFFLFGIASTAMAMSSLNYRIDWDSLNTGGNEFATSTNYFLHDTVGEVAPGTSSGSAYQLAAGYRAGESMDRISISVAGQTTTSTSSSYTGINVAMGRVTGVATGLFAVGDAIAVVENVGFDQLTAIGQIANITTTFGTDTLTVTNFQLDGALSISPSGGDDYVYRLQGTWLPFGTVSSTVQTTRVLRILVHSSLTTGYQVYMQAMTDLNDGLGHAIAPVLDGAVSSGSEEYGSEGVGLRATSLGTDLAVTTTSRLIQSSLTYSDETTYGGDQTAQVFKLSVTDSTIPGSYNQTLVYSLIPRY